MTSSLHQVRLHQVPCRGSASRAPPHNTLNSPSFSSLFQGTIWNIGNSQQLPPFKDKPIKISRRRPLHRQAQAPEQQNFSCTSVSVVSLCRGPAQVARQRALQCPLHPRPRPIHPLQGSLAHHPHGHPTLVLEIRPEVEKVASVPPTHFPHVLCEAAGADSRWPSGFSKPFSGRSKLAGVMVDSREAQVPAPPFLCLPSLLFMPGYLIFILPVSAKMIPLWGSGGLPQCPVCNSTQCLIGMVNMGPLR
jgi:hypothetical protein